MVRAIVIEEADGGISTAVGTFDEAALPEGDVTVDVAYSTVNYKDALAMVNGRPVVGSFPMVPGIDFAGTVAASASDAWAVGDAVVLNGWGVGERRFGGLAEQARVEAGWLVAQPAGLSARDCMVIGTAGYTAMLSVMLLEEQGVTPAGGPVLVTGATGGVGSVAVSVLAGLGYDVVAATGKATEEPYLRGLGATGRHRPRRAERRGAPAREAAVGRGHRQRRERDAGQRARGDVVRRHRHRVRKRGRHGPAVVGRAVHPARRPARRRRVGDGTDRAAPDRLGPARHRAPRERA